MEVVTPTVKVVQRKREVLSDYGWMDGTTEVKILLDYENANEIEDSNILVESEAKSVRFTIQGAEKDQVLFIDSLHDSIESVRYVKKPSKFIIYLKKSLEANWYQLKKSKN